MKYIGVLLICLLFYSCNYFKVKKTSANAILQEELQTFNWNEVDEYPSFASCDSLTEKQVKKTCFETTIARHVLAYLSEENIVVSKDLNDTIYIDFKLSEKGEISILDIVAQQNIQEEIPNLTECIRKSIDSLPKIYPAIKRGQQVVSQFKLPFIIKSD